MGSTVTLIPGDGVTVELVDPVVSVLDRAGADVAFELREAGRQAWKRSGTALPDETLESVRRNRVALKGKLRSREDDPYRSPNWELRKKLGLYASVLPVRNLAGLPARHEGVDLVVIRQALEDVYSGLEHTIREGIVASLKVVTAEASTRITRFAFDYARATGRSRVTLVHKANIMKVTDGLFIGAAQAVAAEQPDVRLDTMIVDNACMQLLLRPQRFEILLMGNLYGGIMSDLGAGIVGGISATMGASFGEGLAVFEAIHGDAPSLEGTGRANPLPLLLPACYMLEHLGQAEVADRIRSAASRVLASTTTTPDLGGSATAAEMCRAIETEL